MSSLADLLRESGNPVELLRNSQAGPNAYPGVPAEFTCQNFSIDDQVALADRGCLIERCLTTPYSSKTTYEHVFEGVRAVGIERNFFSSDCGNPDYPPVEDGQAIWADELLEGGFSEDEIRTMVVEGSRRLVE